MAAITSEAPWAGAHKSGGQEGWSWPTGFSFRQPPASAALAGEPSYRLNRIAGCYVR